MSHCPSNWRQIGIIESKVITLVTIEVFSEDVDMLIVQNKIKTSNIENNPEIAISARTENLWNKNVNALELNCEASNEFCLSFTGMAWRSTVLHASTSDGEVYSLPDITLQYGCGIEMKNLLSLQSELIQTSEGQVESIASFNEDDLILCGEGGVKIISKEVHQKGKKKKIISTISKLDLQFDRKPEKITKITNNIFLLQLNRENGLTNMIIDIKADEVIFAYNQSMAKVRAACPVADGSILVAHEGGLIQLIKSEVEILFEQKIDFEIVNIQAGPVKDTFYIGTEDGFLVIIRLDRKNSTLTVLNTSRIFLNELSFIEIDPFGRSMILGSNKNDKILVLGWSNRSSLLPSVIGYVPVDGVVRSISISSPTAQSSLHVLASISKNESDPIDAAITFEINPEIIFKNEVEHLNNLFEFDPNSIKCGSAQLPPLSTIYMTDCISGCVTCFASSPAQRSVRQIEFNLGDNNETQVDFTRSLNKVNSHNVNFAVPSHGLWVASACRSGLLQFSRNFNEKILIPSSENGYNLKFNDMGDYLMIYTSQFLQVVHLDIKKETLQRAKEFNDKRLGYVESIFMNASEYTAAEINHDPTTADWFERQLAWAVERENEKYKKSKNEIENELDQLRIVVQKMLDENKAADELEKLEDQEFNLDLEAAEIVKMKEIDQINEIQEAAAEERQNCSEIVSKITKYYWKELETGPRMIKTFSGSMGISNFEIEERMADDAVELDNAIEKRYHSCMNYR